MKWKGKRKSGKGKGEGKELKNERGAVAACVGSIIVALNLN